MKANGGNTSTGCLQETGCLYRIVDTEGNVCRCLQRRKNPWRPWERCDNGRRSKSIGEVFKRRRKTRKKKRRRGRLLLLLFWNNCPFYSGIFRLREDMWKCVRLVGIENCGFYVQRKSGTYLKHELLWKQSSFIICDLYCIMRNNSYTHYEQIFSHIV